MRFAGLVFLVSIAATPLVAQAGPNRAALQRQIIERIITNYANQAALSDDQLVRVRQTIGTVFAERREIEATQRQLMMGLERQLRPGVAASADSLAALITALDDNRQAFVDLQKRSQEEFATFLDPVQHAQMVLMLERFQRQVENMLRRRLQGGPAQRPGGN